MAIGASVGKGGVNDLADVIVVQHLLNDWLAATGQPELTPDGDCGPRTIAAITAYQAQVVGLPKPDGLVTPGGKTWTALASGQGSSASLSGAAWWRANQAKYPIATSLPISPRPFGNAPANSSTRSRKRARRSSYRPRAETAPARI